jgi:phage gp36-like protein
MFLTTGDMPTVIYGYQLDQITEGNDDIIDAALAAAEEEIRSYLTGNNRTEWLDGRLRYDVEAIMAAEGEYRNKLIVKHGVTIAKWWIVELCNADVIYEQTKERYDRTIDWLKMLSKGTVTLSSLPQIDGDAEEREPFGYGSRTKFNHE